jgi:hypothetical protein
MSTIPKVGTQAAPGRSSGPVPDKSKIDDVVHAYRWMLGREPESLEVIERHLVDGR